MKNSLLIMVIIVLILTFVSGCTTGAKDMLPKTNITENDSGKSGNLSIMINTDSAPLCIC